MPLYVLKKSDIPRFFDALPFEVALGTISTPQGITLERLTPENMSWLTAEGPRPVESPKTALFPVKELVAEYPGVASPRARVGETLYIGARACDLAAVRILDRIFLEGDFADPFYAARRALAVFVSVDCLEFSPMCFCAAVGGKPYVEKPFDLNLTPLRDCYIVEIVSDAAKQIALSRSQLLEEVTPEQVTERDGLRRRTLEKLVRENLPPGFPVPLPPLSETALESGDAIALYERCVECGACSFVCPTCHCFQLYDQASDRGENIAERIKAWDSCLYGSFARMAGVGGAKPNPSAELRSRFANRIDHKFVWMRENLQHLGCVGCGRCTEACLGGADLRDVLAAATGMQHEKALK